MCNLKPPPTLDDIFTTRNNTGLKCLKCGFTIVNPSENATHQACVQCHASEWAVIGLTTPSPASTAIPQTQVHTYITPAARITYTTADVVIPNLPNLPNSHDY